MLINLHDSQISRRLSYGLAMVVTATLIASCGEAEFASQSGQVATPSVAGELLVTPAPTVHKPEQTPDPLPPTPVPSDPMVLTLSVTLGPPLPPETLVQRYGTIVTGTIVEALPSQWTTPDGQRPENPWESVPGTFTIITPYVLELDGTLALNLLGADLSTGRVVIATEGGQVGQDVVRSNAPSEQLAVGQRVLVALTNEYGHNEDIEILFPTPAGLAWSIASKYVITDDGMAVNHAGSQPLAELVAAILTAAQTSEPATPTVIADETPLATQTVP
jgi:hypothetical protein